jgi:SAM-dependent methyltransferase
MIISFIARGRAADERTVDITRRTAVPLLLVPLGLWAQTSASNDEWSAFVTWVRAAPQETFLDASEAFPAYKKKLIADGVSEADAEALTKRLRDRALNNWSEWMGVVFDRIYGQDLGSRRTTPNAFLVETVRTLKPGKALDVGMGEGRNAVFLAQQGWDVTGVDISGVAVAQAKERARKLGVKIDARVEDIDQFDFGTSQWDLVCLMYFIIGEQQRSMYQLIATALKLGGHVIAEGFGIPPLDRLLKEWAKWEPTKLQLVRLEYAEGQGDWGSRPGSGVPRLLLRRGN